MNDWLERPSRSALAHRVGALGLVPDLIVSSRSSGALPDRAPLAASARRALPGSLEGALRLKPQDAVARSARSLARVIAERRSGSLASGQLELSTLTTLLAECHPPPASLVPQRALCPVIFPVLFAVDGVAAGIYRYEPEFCALLPITRCERDVVRQHLLQWDHGTGTAILFFAVPLSGWLHAEGDRGYASALLSIGYMADQLYLLAERAELTYTVTGGFAASAIDRLLGLDGHDYTVPFAFIVGGRRPGGVRER